MKLPHVTLGVGMFLIAAGSFQAGRFPEWWPLFAVAVALGVGAVVFSVVALRK